MSEADQQSILPEDELAEAFAQIEALSQESPGAADPATPNAEPPSDRAAEVETDAPAIPENDIAAALDELAAAAEELSSKPGGEPPPAPAAPAETPDNHSAGPADHDATHEPPAEQTAGDADDPDTPTPQPPAEAGAPPADQSPPRPAAGDVSFSNALVADDEVAAALAEIESLEDDEAANIPSLDDGTEGAFTSGSAKLTPDEQPDSPTPAAKGGTNDLSADAELAAALAEIETISTQEKRPAAAQVKETRASESAAADQASQPEPPADKDAHAETEEKAPAKRIRFKIKKKPGQDEHDAGAYQPPAKGDATTGGVTLPETPLLKRVVRLLDRLLDAINRPFARLSDTQRNAIGYAAAATLATSLLASLLMPRALPYRDATTFLREKAAAVRAADTHAGRPQPTAAPPADAHTDTDTKTPR